MDDSRSDAELIDASLQRPAEFGLVFERHWDTVFQFFERRLGPDPAPDLASEVSRIAFERRTSYETGDGISCLPWLYGIAANLALKEHRRFSRHLAAIGRYARFRVADGDDHATEVAASVDSEDLWSQLQPGLKALDEMSREMLLLVAWEGLSYQQVADVFGIPLGTVRSRLHRARTRLRTLLNAPIGPVIDTAIRERGK